MCVRSDGPIKNTQTETHVLAHSPMRRSVELVVLVLVLMVLVVLHRSRRWVSVRVCEGVRV